MDLELWNLIEELPPKEKGFQVFHRRLKVGKEVYNSTMSAFPQPFKEEGYQDFVARYLQAKGDPGVVGMVRVETTDDNIVLDAAVRYPVSTQVEFEDDAYFWSS